ncbi:MAG: ATP-binding protein [Legionellaceae bacterium]|nr:ATP-binding protein [Legionellaceae bacterium]
MFKRFIESNVREALLDTPVVFIMGPRQSGKTTVVKHIIDLNWVYITFDDVTQLHLAQSDPIGFIRNLPEGKSIVLDEVQRLPELFVSIKQAVDENRRPGRFLLTGSANALLLPKLSDSLAGRMETVALTTLSEYEFLNRTPSFLHLVLQGKAPQTDEIRIRSYMMKRIVTGSFPEPIQRTKPSRITAWYREYIQTLIQKDIRDLGDITHYDEMMRLLEVMALFSGKLINFTAVGEKVGLNRATVKKYLLLLEQLFLMDTLPAWHTNAYKRLIKTPKVHLLDTGLICALRGIEENKLAEHPELYGALLETFIFNELKKQASFSGERLRFSHYRDKDQLEVDILIENGFDEIIAIEIKAASTITRKDLLGLKKLKEVAKGKFKIGIILYDGDHTTSFGDKLFAVPLASLWAGKTEGVCDVF